MLIRSATRKDASRLKELLVQLGYELSLEKICNKIEVYLNKESYSVLVIEKDKVILGFITMVCYESFVFEGSCMHIESLVIDEKYRSKGIGKKLMESAEEYAKNQGCSFIELITLEKRKNDGTHNFYEKLGYQDQVKTGLSYFFKEI